MKKKQHKRQDTVRYQEYDHKTYVIKDGIITTYSDGENESRQFNNKKNFRKDNTKDTRAMERLAKAKMKYCGSDADSVVTKEARSRINPILYKQIPYDVNNDFDKMKSELLNAKNLCFVGFERGNDRVIHSIYAILCKNDSGMPIEDVYYCKVDNSLSVPQEITLTDEVNNGKTVKVQSMYLAIKELNWTLEEWGMHKCITLGTTCKHVITKNVDMSNDNTKVAVDKLFDSLIIVDKFLDKFAFGTYNIDSTKGNTFVELVKYFKVRSKDGYYNKHGFYAPKLYNLFRALHLNKKDISEITFDRLEDRYQYTFAGAFKSGFNDKEKQLIVKLAKGLHYRKMALLLCSKEYVSEDIKRFGNRDCKLVFIKTGSNDMELVEADKFDIENYGPKIVTYEFDNGKFDISELYAKFNTNKGNKK